MSESPAGPPGKINPFLVPGREDAPMTTLCPWRVKTHEDLYVEVDNYAPALDDFKIQFTTPSLLRESSRLAIVTGDTGCGKSALRHHCAYWLRDEMVKSDLSGVIIDLSREIDPTDRKNPIIDINKRISHVSSVLVPKLARLDLIDAETREALATAETPSLVYGELAAAMEAKGRADVVLILLLPPSDHLGEVLQYAAMPGQRIVFFAESAFLSASQLDSIGDGHDVEVPPAKMTVGPLSSEDIELFIDTRFEQRKDAGVFPRLEDAVRKKLMSTKPMTIAMLQHLLAGLYNRARRVSEDYSNEAEISADELTNYLLWRYGA